MTKKKGGVTIGVCEICHWCTKEIGLALCNINVIHYDFFLNLFFNLQVLCHRHKLNLMLLQ